MSGPQIVPEITELTAPYWKACREGWVALQQCDTCGHSWHPPQPTCPICRRSEWTWVRAGDSGKVYSFAVIRHAAHDAVVAKLPYIVALITLDEGPNILMNIVDCGSVVPYVGMPVVFRLAPSPGGLELVQAAPARSPSVVASACRA